MPVNKPRYYSMTLMAGSNGSSPNDATTYYLAAHDAGASFTTNTGYTRIYIPKTGVLRDVLLNAYAVVAGTGEAWEWFVEYPIGVTDTSIDSQSVAGSFRQWRNNNLNIPVTEGDYLYIKTTTPTWVTNPENVRITTTLLIECE